MIVACAVLGAVPALADAKPCASGQFDRGGTCTSFRTAARRVVHIARSVMAAQGAKAVILRIDLGNRTLVNRAFGVSMEGVPATSKMHFRPGAMTIPMMTALLLQLQDQRRLSLNDKLSRWYPNYPNADRVTLRMLASSTAGYPDYIQNNPVFLAAWHADVFRHWYGLGVDLANGWMFQIPQFNGDNGILGYLRSRGISLIVENTNGPNVPGTKNISGTIAKQITLYLTPDRPITR